MTMNQSLNYTQLSILDATHVYVEGTDIIIFLLIIIAFCNMLNISAQLIKFYFPSKSKGGL